MKTLNTPSPWQVDHSGTCHIGITDKNERTIAFCNLQNEDGDEDEANARLIAAAPDLLSALENLADYVFAFEGKQNICTSVWMDAREAIAKAKGAV